MASLSLSIKVSGKTTELHVPTTQKSEGLQSCFVTVSCLYNISLQRSQWLLENMGSVLYFVPSAVSERRARTWNPESLCQYQLGSQETYVQQRGILCREQCRQRNSLYHWVTHQPESFWWNFTLMEWHRLVGTTPLSQGPEQSWHHLLSPHLLSFRCHPDPTFPLSCMCKSPPHPWSSWPWSQAPRAGVECSQTRQQDATGPN